MLGVVLAVAVSIQAKRPTMPVYGATVVWAIIGLITVNWGQNPTVAYCKRLGVWNFGLRNGFLSACDRKVRRIGVPGISKCSRKPFTR